MIVDIRQLEDVKIQFTELGVALSDLSDKNDQTFDDLRKSFLSLNESVSSLLGPEELQNLRGTTQAIIKYTQELAPIFDKISGVLGTHLSNLERALGGASQDFERIANELSAVGVPVEKALQRLQGKKKEEKKPKEDKIGYIEREKQTLKGLIRRGAGVLKLPLPGAILGGGIMLAAWGLKEKDRVRKEVGEAVNLLTYAFDSGMRGLVERAASYIGTLGDQLNKFYGIARQDVQSITKAYVDGGVGIKEMLRDVDRSFGRVGENYITFALGLDKMFELTSGESARRMTDIMADYGKNLEGARETWMTMLMAGKDSGIGAARFVKNVTAAADSLKELGFSIDNVVNLAVGLQAAYQEMGVPRQMAGQQAALGLQQLARGMTSMSDAWKRLVGEEMGLGTGLEAKQKFEDVIQRITSRSESEEADLELQNAIMAMVHVASRGGREGEIVTREILGSDMGLGFKGAQAAMAIKEAVDSGDLKKASKITEENKRIFRESLETEGQRQSKWQRHMNQWLQGIGKIGQSLMAYIGYIAANLIAYFKALPTMLLNYIMEDKEANDKILEEIRAVTGTTKKAGELFWSGISDLKKASIKGGMEIFGDSIGALEGALRYDPSNLGSLQPPIPRGPRVPGAIPKPQTVLPGGLALGAAPKPIPLTVGDRPTRQFPTPAPVEPMVRTILVPISEPGVYPVEPIAYGDKPQLVEGAPKIAKMNWVGGGINIVNRSVGGVTSNGDIILEAVGNCPRCGLIFGEDFSQASDYARTEMPMFSEEDEVALARMLRSEVGGHRELEGATRTEAVGIAFTAINRLRSGRFGGSTLRDVITGGEGFGRQGTTKTGRMRPYSTKKEATAASRQLAREVLAGYYADPTGGATYFYHSTRGQGYGSRKQPGLRTALPQFTRGKINTLNIGLASFWASKKMARQQAADASEWAEKEQAKFERVHRTTPASVAQAPSPVEEWELETGRTEMD